MLSILFWFFFNVLILGRKEFKNGYVTFCEGKHEGEMKSEITHSSTTSVIFELPILTPTHLKKKVISPQSYPKYTYSKFYLFLIFPRCPFSFSAKILTSMVSEILLFYRRIHSVNKYFKALCTTKSTGCPNRRRGFYELQESILMEGVIFGALLSLKKATKYSQANIFCRGF